MNDGSSHTDEAGRVQFRSWNLWFMSKWMGLIPIALIVVLTAILATSNVHASMAPPILFPILNTLFIFSTYSIAAYFAARTFLRTGSWQLLSFGTGILILGTSATLAAWLSSVGGLNLVAKIHNVNALVASFLILSVATLAWKGVSPRKEPGRLLTLITAYAAALAFIALVTVLALENLIPTFANASGPTMLRQAIYGTATAILGISAFWLLLLYYRSKTDFLYWCCLGLMLITIGFTTGLFAAILSDTISWLSRLSLYFSGIYFIVAVLVARAEAQTRGVEIYELIAEFAKQAKVNYELLVNTASDAIIAVDGLGRILTWNPAAEKMFGYNRSEAIGLAFFDLIISPEHVASYKKAADTVGPGRDDPKPSVTIELKARKRNGEEFPVELTLASRKPAAEFLPTTTLILRDITERKRAEEALRENEARFRSVLDNSQDVIYRLNVQTGSYEYISPSAETVVGFSPDELMALDVETSLAMIHPDDLPTMRAVLARLEDTGKGELEYRQRTKNGDYRWISNHMSLIKDSADRPLYRNGNIRDITERKMVEEALRKAHDELEIRVQERTVELDEANVELEAKIKEQQRANEQIRKQAELLDKAEDAIALRDLNHRFIYWNKGSQRLYGWKEEEIIDKNADELLYKEESPNLIEAKRRVIKEGEWKGELEQITKDGKEIIVESHWTLMRDNRGKPESILIINTDITEKKKLESQLLRAQRMESIGTLAGGIAHDLNNVLTPIMLSLQMLKGKITDGQSQKLFATLEQSSQRGASLIKQVLTFARGIEGERNPIQMKHIISEIEKIAKETFPRDIEIRTNIQKDLFTIFGDATQLHQVMMNLCINARDAMSQGGTLSISAESFIMDENYSTISAEAKAGPYIVVAVSDTGTGIPPSILDRIFEPFFTTKEQGKGTGLGLSTSLAIVKSHGGFINVYSEVGKGTVFKVYLPAVKSEILEAEAQQFELPSGKGEYILVAEDEASIREITVSILETYGYKVLSAADGADAVALYAQNKDKIKVVLMDMMMPVMDGQTSIQAIRRINPEVKVIAASGLAEKDKLEKITNIQVQAFLPKPYTTERLLKAMHEVLSAK
jgi:two-component system cell cycle sensor histidine kinase/response regulator CckA